MGGTVGVRVWENGRDLKVVGVGEKVRPVETVVYANLLTDDLATEPIKLSKVLSGYTLYVEYTRGIYVGSCQSRGGCRKGKKPG